MAVCLSSPRLERFKEVQHSTIRRPSYDDAKKRTIIPRLDSNDDSQVVAESACESILLSLRRRGKGGSGTPSKSLRKCFPQLERGTAVQDDNLRLVQPRPVQTDPHLGTTGTRYLETYRDIPTTIDAGRGNFENPTNAGGTGRGYRGTLLSPVIASACRGTLDTTQMRDRDREYDNKSLKINGEIILFHLVGDNDCNAGIKADKENGPSSKINGLHPVYLKALFASLRQDGVGSNPSEDVYALLVCFLLTVGWKTRRYFLFSVPETWIEPDYAKNAAVEACQRNAEEDGPINRSGPGVQPRSSRRRLSVSHDTVKSEIPQIVKMLGDSDREVRQSATGAFGKLANHSTAVFHDATKAGIPQIVEMLGDSDRELRESSTRTFGRLADHTTVVFDDSMKPGIPHIVEMLRATDREVKQSATRTFGKLADHVVFHDSMKPGIPHIVEMLRDTDREVRQSATRTFGKLADHALFHDTMKAGIPQIVEMLGDSDRELRESSTRTFGRVADHATAVFHDALKAGIPQITEMLGDSDREVRQSATYALGTLAPEFHLFYLVSSPLSRGAISGSHTVSASEFDRLCALCVLAIRLLQLCTFYIPASRTGHGVEAALFSLQVSAQRGGRGEGENRMNKIMGGKRKKVYAPHILHAIPYLDCWIPSLTQHLVRGASGVGNGTVSGARAHMHEGEEGVG
ncbi:armadillo-type protein [Mycena metata]|uniref:non-specific serine/threonine protein kinase n=1 Tax=Mycena metata TaxID=1033252 RepID=A0AAD7HEC5_9AGAR|nr:armadillo-type protein [Mycena metata]